MITDIAQVTEGRLCWPDSKPRAARRDKGPFKGHAIGDREREIIFEMQRWGVKTWVVSRNRFREMAGDPAVALWWLDRRKGDLRVLACDRYETQANNAHAINLTLHAMRALERWGAYTAEQAAEGARLALPAPDMPSLPWWQAIPGVVRDWPLPAIEGMYRDAMKTADEKRQRDMNRAIEAARAEKRLAPR